MEDIIIAFDAGGTSIKVAAMNLNNDFLSDIIIYPSHSHESAETIIHHFHNIIHQTFDSVYDGNQRLIGISIGFPGPFNYERGISYMKNIGKYNYLYGYNFKGGLLQLLITFPTKQQDDNLSIVFANDATLFVLGEFTKFKSKSLKKMMGITIGTGCGSTFIEEGKIIASKYGLPDDGMIFHLPYEDSIIDDYISKRGILNIAQKNGYFIDNLEVINIYNDAQSCKKNAIETFKQFGENLLAALLGTINSFKPDIIVFGGQISKAYEFFGQQMNTYAKANAIQIVINPASSDSALIGANQYWNDVVIRG